MKLILSALIFMTLHLTSFSQGAQVKFVVTTYDLEKEEIIKGSTMLIYKDGELASTTITDGKKNKAELQGTSKYIGIVRVPGYHDFYFGLDVSKSNDEGKHTLDMPVKLLALDSNVEEPKEADIFAFDPDPAVEPVIPVPVEELKKQISKK